MICLKRILFFVAIFQITTSSFALTFKSEIYHDKDATRVEYKSYYGKDLFGNVGAEIDVHGYLWMPANIQKGNKVPLVILTPGMSGMKGYDTRMCKVLSDAGIACFGARVYNSRGLKTYPDPTALPGKKQIMIAGIPSRVADAYSALYALSTIPELDIKNAWMGGWSAGGLAARLSVSKDVSDPFMRFPQDFKGFFSLYSHCLSPINTMHKTTTFKAFWGEDDWVYNAKACEKMIQDMKAKGINASSHLFEGKVGHAWDIMDWKQNKMGWERGTHRFRAGGPDVYKCNGQYDFKKRKITFKGGEVNSFSDMLTWEEALKVCGIQYGYSWGNKKVTDIVDQQIIEMVLGKK